MRKPLGYVVLTGLLLMSASLHTSVAEKRANEKISAYSEQLILHIDKPLHLVGERIYFKVYAVAMAEGSVQSSLSRVAYLELLDRTNTPVIQLKIALNNGSGSGILDIPKHLRTDYYVLRAYTNWMKNSGPSGFFHQVQAIANPFMPIGLRNPTGDPVEISGVGDLSTDQRFVIRGTVDAPVYGKREKVALQLSTRNRSEKPIGAELSVSVYRMDELQRVGSEKGQQFVGDPIAPVTIGGEAQYAIEKEGPLITGKIVDRSTGRAKKGVSAYLSAIGDPSVLCMAVSDDTGRVVFNPPRLVGHLEGVVEFVDADSSSRIMLENPFSESYLNRPLPEISLSPALDSLLTAYSIQTQLDVVFRHRDTAATPVYRPFYGEADKTYRLEDYTQFATLREIFREYVLEVAPRGVDDDLTLRLLNKAEGYMFERNPLMLYDGVPVLEAHKLMALNLREIESFDVVTARYYHGNAEFDGILSFKSHQGNFHRSLFNPNALVVDIMGTQPVTANSFPAYVPGDRRERIPDLRSTLYWNPSVHTDSLGVVSVEFFTSDVRGTFAVVVQGIDATGQRGDHMFTFEVK